jgi:dienelactone hydrolase
LIVAPDPFWRVGGGVVSYDDHEGALGRLKDFDLRRCIGDLSAVLDWTQAHSNHRILGLGICFGGPFVLRFAADHRLSGIVTWHGSRMQDHLDRASEIVCPLRLHFGSIDPITPPEAIEAIRERLAAHEDLSIVIHPDADHGFSHDGASHDPVACRAGLDAIVELLDAGVFRRAE